ncbi:hypothetical protein [Actinosynnema mirum]|uniref:Uncharacterized protein n=1 Tax=Actinosynnema mirum (strain ATCC 29888 / DSM 43827 / JCM 3225 / NBRC 14064 / NCIMB 13271 / NRRL B-12336 / IMRU 3971 / 101) TaxID=446462 RepID=C6WF19_ACTMD|nr:hypothetical protein [Actinosynnema mirum]ACU34151.1 hypothetical protein Amir_0180 [Actinosynnema mirum DSM 43827]
MITTNCRGCGEIADCDINELCDYCANDPEINPDLCDECGGFGCEWCTEIYE